MIDLSVEHNLQFAFPTAFLAGVDVLLERPDFDDARALAESIQLEPACGSISGRMVIVATVAGPARRTGAAIADLRSAVDSTKLRLRNPIMGPWRSELALLLPREAAGKARTLVASGWPMLGISACRCEGTALRAAGLVEGGQRAIELLGESLRVLDHSNLSLERARTLVELGAALRRAERASGRGGRCGRDSTLLSSAASSGWRLGRSKNSGSPALGLPANDHRSRRTDAQ